MSLGLKKDLKTFPTIINPCPSPARASCKTPSSNTGETTRCFSRARHRGTLPIPGTTTPTRSPTTPIEPIPRATTTRLTSSSITLEISASFSRSTPIHQSPRLPCTHLPLRLSLLSLSLSLSSPPLTESSLSSFFDSALSRSSRLCIAAIATISRASRS